MLVRQISIDKLQEEPKKLGPGFKNSITSGSTKNPNESLYSLFLNTLLPYKQG
jgi:protein phosphatase